MGLAGLALYAITSGKGRGRGKVIPVSF